MICVVIKGPTAEQAADQIQRALPYADLVELRLDYFRSVELEAVRKLLAESPVPVLLTLRSRDQGGHFRGSEEERRQLFVKLAALKPAYLDVESHLPVEFTSSLRGTQLIISYHNFSETPEDLDRILQEMKTHQGSLYKIAVHAHASTDTLRLLSWARQTSDNLIAISMGSLGEVSRILAPIIGSKFTYASLDDDLQTAPGQISAKVLVERYNYKRLNQYTKIYGLIGNPIVQSVGDIWHNQQFQKKGINAVYVKIPVKLEELPAFFHYLHMLPIYGLSVTMPLKEVVMKHVDHIEPQAQAIGAVNTLKITDSKIYGSNTDGIGALNAIEKQMAVKGKHIVLSGAGGAAKAIAYEARQRGAHVTILNRNPTRAKEVAAQLNCAWGSMDDITKQYDILINATPSAMPIPASCILPNALVMDIKTQPRDTELLTHALEKGCRIVYGYDMFQEQAWGQFNQWFVK